MLIVTVRSIANRQSSVVELDGMMASNASITSRCIRYAQKLVVAMKRATVLRSGAKQRVPRYRYAARTRTAQSSENAALRAALAARASRA
jgi:hypothetical protein